MHWMPQALEVANIGSCRHWTPRHWVPGSGKSFVRPGQWQKPDRKIQDGIKDTAGKDSNEAAAGWECAGAVKLSAKWGAAGGKEHQGLVIAIAAGTWGLDIEVSKLDESRHVA
ncbi:hypothetical protein FRX31_021889 [Thalictrum thalictroides]|uniref:Uncharacterized protein n=1 Tax=Thalictrum thalictroides TaxID=46969 RepID=A0A7J6VTX0_THATH|nr:hypothetical protein FRX31_021889 [Thalictrum thalictroides]